MSTKLRRSTIAAAVALIFAASGPVQTTLANEPATPSKVRASGDPVVNEQGLQLHKFFLNELEVKAADVTGIPEPRKAADLRNIEDWRGWHTKHARALLSAIEADHGVQAVSMTGLHRASQLMSLRSR